MSRSVKMDYDALREIKPENAEVRVGVDGDTIILATLTEGHMKIIHQGSIPDFSIREVSEALQTELWPEQKRIAAQLLKQKP